MGAADAPVRPGWHTDAKWVVGIIAFFLVAATAFLGVLVRLTEREPAVELLTVGIATAFSPEGLDDTGSLEDVRKAIRESPTKSFKPFPGSDAAITEADLASGSPRELRLRLFRQIAEPIYDKTTLSSTTQEGTVDAPTASSVGVLAFLSAEVHAWLTQPLLALLMVDVVLLVLMVWFSTRFGRLASLGWLFTGVSFLPAVLFTVLEIAAQRQLPSTGSEASLTSQASQIAAGVAPTVIAIANSVYRPMLGVGLLLILIAGVGALVVKRRATKSA